MGISRRFLALIAAGGLAACNSPSTSGPPITSASMAKASPSGDGQTAVAASVLPEAFRVQISHNGAPVNGIFVEWRVTGGGGSLSQSQSVTTSSGIASTTLTLGPSAGINTVEASSSGVTGSPLTFTATAIVTGSAGAGQR